MAKISKLDESVKDPDDDRLVKYYCHFLLLCFVKPRKQLLEQLKSITAKLESSSTRVKLFERTEETLVIKRSADDPTPVQLPVKKHVSPIRGLFYMLCKLRKLFQALAAFSPFFEKLFYGPFKESKTGIFQMIEPKAEALVSLISIVARCDFKRINKNNGITFFEQKQIIKFLVLILSRINGNSEYYSGFGKARPSPCFFGRTQMDN